jgi:hypothetical protein
LSIFYIFIIIIDDNMETCYNAGRQRTQIGELRLTV